ncbi:MAG: BTAD domain-containing putative transcriptional regulator [Gemmatimonadaceae bacterium]
MLRLRTFGGLSVERNGAPLPAAAASRRRIALLPLLAVAGDQGVSRDKVFAYLWPESDTDRARNALAQTLHALRRQLGEDELFVVGRELRLNSNVIFTDVGEFEAAIRRGEYERAAELYAGPFLDGFYVREAPEFERWAATERARIEQQAKDSLRVLATKAAERGDHVRSAEYWRRLAALDPLSSQVATGFMTALARGGDRAAALEYAGIYGALVRQELGVAPDAAVTALANRLRDELPARPVEKSGHTSRAGSAVSTATEPEEAPALSEFPRTPRYWGRRWIVGGAAALAALIGGALTVSRYAPRRELDPNLVVVAPFDVLDPELVLWREGLVDVLSRNLDGAGPLRTVSPTIVVRRWRGHSDFVSVADLARRTGARLAVFGSLLAAGPDSVRLQAVLVDVAAERRIAELELREASPRMDRLTDSLTVRLIRELSRTRPIGAARLTSFGSSSLPALKAFLQGEQFFRRSAWDSALAYYERAVSQDSTFVLALRRLSRTMSWQYPDRATLFAAYALRVGAVNRGLTTRESLLVAGDSLEGALWGDATSPTSLARRLFAVREEVVRHYPSDPEAWYDLGEASYHWGFLLDVTAQRALQAFDRSIALDSAFGPAYEHIVDLALFLGDLGAARRYVAAFLASDPRGTFTGAKAFRLVGRSLDPARQLDREVERVLRTGPTDLRYRVWEKFSTWGDAAERAVQIARLGIASDSATARVYLAQSLAYRGHLRDAWRLATPTLRAELALYDAAPRDTAAALFALWLRDRNAPFAVRAVRWWAARGDVASLDEARRLFDSTSRLSPDSMERAWARYGTEIVSGYLALARRDTAEALRQFLALRQLAPLSRYYSERFTRARLLASRAKGRQAALLLDPVVWSPVVWALPSRIMAALEQGRAAERAGDRERASRAYRLVADVWQHADPELRPYAAEARAAMKRLGGRR